MRRIKIKKCESTFLDGMIAAFDFIEGIAVEDLFSYDTETEREIKTEFANAIIEGCVACGREEVEKQMNKK